MSRLSTQAMYCPGYTRTGKLIASKVCWIRRETGPGKLFVSNPQSISGLRHQATRWEKVCVLMTTNPTLQYLALFRAFYFAYFLNDTDEVELLKTYHVRNIGRKEKM